MHWNIEWGDSKMYVQLGTFRTKWATTQRNIKLAAVTVKEASAVKWCITSSVVLRHVLTDQDRRYRDSEILIAHVTANKVFRFLFKYLQGWKSEQLSS